MHTGAHVVRNALVVMPNARESAQNDSQHCGMLQPGFSADLKKGFSHHVSNHFSNIFCTTLWNASTGLFCRPDVVILHSIPLLLILGLIKV